MANELPTDASSAATLSGTSWLNQLLQTAGSTLVALQTVKNSNRQAGTVTQQPQTVVTDASKPADAKTWWIVGSIVGAVLLLLLLFRRK